MLYTTTIKPYRDKLNLGPEYYKRLRENLSQDKFSKEILSPSYLPLVEAIGERWHKYCASQSLDAIQTLKEFDKTQFQVFFEWMLNEYPAIRAESTIQNKFRTLRTYARLVAGVDIDKGYRNDINTFIRNASKRKGLMRLPGPKPTLNIDDLVRTLHHHWVLDEHVYPDERYRITLHLIMLWGAYTAQRPVSFFGRQTRRSRQLIEQHEHNEIFIPGPDDYAEGEPTTASIDWLTELATDDQAADGPGAVTILYEHVHLLKVRQYESEILVLFVCIVHSKGEDKKPQPKWFWMPANENPLLCPVSPLISLALHDLAFEAGNISSAEDIYQARVPEHKSSIYFRFKESMMKVPVLREQSNSESGLRLNSSDSRKSMSYKTSCDALSRIGRKAGLPQNLVHYCFRRGGGNAIDAAATTVVRDQVMGHSMSEIFFSYTNPVIRCDVEQAFLGNPTDAALARLLTGMSLGADRTAPSEFEELSQEDKRLVTHNAGLVRRNANRERAKQALNYARKHSSPAVIEAAEVRHQEAKKVYNRELRKGRKMLLDTRRNLHFQQADTAWIEGDSSADAVLQPPSYRVPQRASIASTLETFRQDKHIRQDLRHEFINEMKSLCGMEDDARRARSQKSDQNYSGMEQRLELHYAPHHFPIQCHPAQCLVCLGKNGLSYQSRIFKFAKVNKMLDHFDSKHLKELSSHGCITCPHPQCNEIVLEDISHFKNHARVVHGITLRN